MTVQLTIDDLILAYQKDVKRVMTFFYEKYGRRDLLRAKGEKAIPASGHVDGLGPYQFHGIGLRCEMGKTEVDVDFGPDDRIDGFDAWRLFIYNESLNFRYGTLPDRDSVQRILETMVSLGRIKQVPDSHNFYWADFASTHTS